MNRQFPDSGVADKYRMFVDYLSETGSNKSENSAGLSSSDTTENTDTTGLSSFGTTVSNLNDSISNVSNDSNDSKNSKKIKDPDNIYKQLKNSILVKSEVDENSNEVDIKNNITTLDQAKKVINILAKNVSNNNDKIVY